MSVEKALSFLNVEVDAPFVRETGLSKYIPHSLKLLRNRLLAWTMRGAVKSGKGNPRRFSVR